VLVSTPGTPLFVSLGLDVHVLGFAAALAVSHCLLPAIRATRIAPASAMRAGGRALSAGCKRFRLRRILVITQMALSLVLVVGALLFVRSLQKLLVVEPGFRPEGIVEVDLDLWRPQYSKERLPSYTATFSSACVLVPA